MSWFSELAGKAENLLNNLDEQTGEALRNHVIKQKKHIKNDISDHSEFPWIPKKRPMPRNLQNISPVVDTRSNVSPTRKCSPLRHVSRSPKKDENVKDRPMKTSAAVKPTPAFILHNCPEMKLKEINPRLKCRRNSFPTDLQSRNRENFISDMQSLEMKNSVMKNKIAVMEKEISVLTDKLHMYEHESKMNAIKLEGLEELNESVECNKKELLLQIQHLKHSLQDVTNNQVNKLNQHNQELNTEIHSLKDKNNGLENKIEELNADIKDKAIAQIKLENELKHAQSTICELENNLEKSTEECNRLERDWEGYKLRVKNMLLAKDEEIKTLRHGVTCDENNKMLMEQLESIKEERDSLTQSLSEASRSNAESRRRAEGAEAQRATAERLAAALRDALKDERAAKNEAEDHCRDLAKELKALHLETSQTIAGLRNALYEKQEEINRLHTPSSSSPDTSALNVADYDAMHEVNEKIQYLTKTLVQRQSKVDSLTAENNMLRIQLGKLETKYKNEVSALKQCSIVNVQESECRKCRIRAPETPLSRLSLRIGLICKRHPVFRVFIMIYMIILHFWVLTVLFSNTPQDLIYKPVMSV